MATTSAPVAGLPRTAGTWQPVVAGASVGLLGGLIGLGGAEFRLPLLIGIFGFAALQAVILNKAMSLIVVGAALPARLAAIPLPAVLDRWTVIVNLLAGTLAGAWAGASWAVRMRTGTLYRVLAGLLVLIAAALYANHVGTVPSLRLNATARVGLGVLAGFAIGAVAAVMGVAGGELLIPTIVVLYGVDVRLAGSLSLAVSLPTMLVAFARYSRDSSFIVLRRHRRFVGLLATGSVAGTIAGAVAVGTVGQSVLVPVLCAVLLLSAQRMWAHR